MSESRQDHPAAAGQMDAEAPELSVVIPVFNEEATVKAVRDEIDAVAREHGYQVDMVFVDDGSTDASWERISELCGTDNRVRGIRFRRNFGKAAALSAGLFIDTMTGYRV